MAAKAKRCIPFCAVFSIGLVLAVAGIIATLKRDKSATETVVDTEENSQEPDVKPKEDISITVNSSSTIKTNSTHKDRHRQRQFCRKCCHTPPCWYNNHKECSKCANKEQLKLHVTSLLRRSHKKAMHHHRRTQKTILKH